MADQEIKFGEMTVHVDEELSGGVYANLVLVNHSPDDFVMDFCFIPPGSGTANVRSRVVVSPGHYKRLVGALQQNLKRYEETFGPIPDKTRPPAAPGDPEAPIN